MKILIAQRLEEQRVKGAHGWEPGTDEGWSLLEPGEGEEGAVKKAVSDLNGAMGKALKALEGALGDVESFDAKVVGPMADKVFRRVVEPVLKRHKGVGANDVEPRYVAVQGLINAVKKHYGVKKWTTLGDYIG